MFNGVFSISLKKKSVVFILVGPRVIRAVKGWENQCEMGKMAKCPLFLKYLEKKKKKSIFTKYLAKCPYFGTSFM